MRKNKKLYRHPSYHKPNPISKIHSSLNFLEDIAT